jgi:uncharacterized protein (TIGR00299 family) protein
MTLQGAHLHLDCGSGIAGDMAMAAFIDLGVPEDVVRAAIAALGLDGIGLRIDTVRRGAFAGKKAEVWLRDRAAASAHGPVIAEPGHDHEHGHHDHVHYSAIRARIVARCVEGVAGWALRIFDRLADAEARRHGVAVDEVAFHELGAADSIADIVGCAAAIDWLRPAVVTCRAVPLGGGTVKTAHGVLAVPAPATLELLRGCVVESGGTCELTTPTGAALVRVLVEDGGFGPMPSGRVLATGHGAGTRELPDRPNLLRIIALQPSASVGDDLVELLEANLDDLAPNLVAPLIDALLEAGAVDAWFTPIVMKKGRPAVTVSALAPPDRRLSVEDVFFRESTTLGVRRSLHPRTVLERRLVEVETELGKVTVKLASRPGRSHEILSAMPELEDCRRIAAETGLPLRRVYEIAAAAGRSRS